MSTQQEGMMNDANKLPAWLVAWRATVKLGHCPACKKALPKRRRGRPAYIHSAKAKPECRAEYLRRRAAATAGTTALKEIRSVKYLDDPPGRAEVLLECGCKLDIQAHAARRTTRRMRCPNHP